MDNKTPTRETKDRRQAKRIFSGQHSKEMWRQINEASDLSELRSALYVVACQCQELEEVLKRKK